MKKFLLLGWRDKFVRFESSATRTIWARRSAGGWDQGSHILRHLSADKMWEPWNRQIVPMPANVCPWLLIWIFASAGRLSKLLPIVCWTWRLCTQTHCAWFTISIMLSPHHLNSFICVGRGTKKHSYSVEAHKHSRLGKVLGGFFGKLKMGELLGEHCYYLSLVLWYKSQRLLPYSSRFQNDFDIWYYGGKERTFLPALRKNTLGPGI